MRAAIGIVRVSVVAGRAGGSFVSPAEQRERIAAACERDGFRLLDTIDELDVSGATPLEQRDGLRTAIERIESGEADVLMVAYFDRLVRSLKIQSEVVGRVEAASGRIVALDVGEISEATATQWITGTFIGAVAEYHRRATRERTGEAQARAVARGAVPWAGIPPGYLREDGTLVIDPATAPAIEEAFALRAAGATVGEVRAFLARVGVRCSYTATQGILRSRLYLGEIHFGELSNIDAHEPIIDRDLWLAVQRVKVPRGRRAKSERLLARLGVLRCASCGARLVVGVKVRNGRRYPAYRCPHTNDCTKRVSIAAGIAESLVVDAVLEAHADATGRASAERRAQDAVATAERAQGNLDAAIRAFAGLDDEPAAREKLTDLRRARDEASKRADHLSGLQSAVVLNLATDWPRLSLDAKRRVIQAAVEVVTVSPGRGVGRVSITLRE